ncbi:hypothetical protein METBIDRAFT_36458 [Metschnikowia bicuspidata var. bicuspidata NRRL YB-4993]|uniref:DUF2470 domain-containing protein n=1 Tax=Metschnikowia bicuspidata var. bicuspidata NRRL YB-4993 TaxID=869754 RepID=A0A1A0HGU3_9ASCO|nr:hypothetical protein METBIDRAFT_36458 [Metschnikowia bicuspidata var. bicuspidata NRRL YB-4993]OBA23216.1 hypothetical protein METBIDRAFT_36458 [Metschnikowia bicuspidata var. bicuspidata NRRL YB-4993]
MTDPAYRIKNHMNKDHHLALVDYVVVYGKERLSNIDVHSVHIAHVTVDELALKYKAKNGMEQDLKLEWNSVDDGEGLRVESMLDIKAKLIAMAKHAAQKQGFSHKQITKILPPKTVTPFVAYAFAALSVATYIKRDFLRSVLGLVFSQNSPGVESFLVFAEKRVLPIAGAMYAIHLLEMLFLVRPKTVKYRMPWPTKLAWMTFSFFEGYLCVPRLNSLTE